MFQPLPFFLAQPTVPFFDIDTIQSVCPAPARPGQVYMACVEDGNIAVVAPAQNFSTTMHHVSRQAGFILPIWDTYVLVGCERGRLVLYQDIGGKLTVYDETVLEEIDFPGHRFNGGAVLGIDGSVVSIVLSTIDTNSMNGRLYFVTFYLDVVDITSSAHIATTSSDASVVSQRHRDGYTLYVTNATSYRGIRTHEIPDHSIARMELSIDGDLREVNIVKQYDRHEWPNGMCLVSPKRSKKRYLYVAVSYGSRVEVIDLDGTVRGVIYTTKNVCPTDVCMDDAGNIFITATSISFKGVKQATGVYYIPHDTLVHHGILSP